MLFATDPAGAVEAGAVEAADGSEDADVGAADASVADADEPSESLHAEPARPSTAIPPILKKVRRSGRDVSAEGPIGSDEVIPTFQHAIEGQHSRSS